MQPLVALNAPFWDSDGGMPLTDRTLLHDPSGVNVHVEPSALFSIVDHHMRRDQGQDFVMGTLLGVDEGGVVTICSSFPVPHTEVEDQIALNSDFHATMLALQQKIEPKHKVVGWYATGESINANTTLFHDFYGQDVERPVHLLFDLGLGGERRMNCKAYVSDELTLGESRIGTAFKQVALTVSNGEADRVGVDTLVKMSGSDSVVAMAGGDGGEASAGELDSVEQTVKKLLHTLEGVTEHVEKVVKGAATADPAVVRLLQQLVASAPRLPTESFGKMFNTQVQDMLTIVYLANLTRTQLALAEKLQAVTLSSASS